jgi:hypothetical protein
MIDLTEARLSLKSDLSTPMPILGIDLDGCVDEAPVFFQLLTAYWPGKVVVITFRDDRAKAETVLKDFQVRYDAIVLVDTFEAKADVIAELGVHTYFDDQPEMLRDIPPTVNVFLVRNEGNFDFDDRRWMFSGKTGKLV